MISICGIEASKYICSEYWKMMEVDRNGKFKLNMLSGPIAPDNLMKEICCKEREW